MIFLIIISGIFAGLLQTYINLPALSLIVYIPMFYNINNNKKLLNGRLKHLKSWHIFILSEKLVSCSFLISVNNLIPLNFIISFIISFLLFLILSLWLTLLTSVPIMLFNKIKFSKTINIISFCILYTLGELFCENSAFLPFPWTTISLGTSSWIEFIQTSSVFGSKFLSFIILLINGFLSIAVFGNIITRKKFMYICTSFIIFSSSFIYGIHHIKTLKNLWFENGKVLNIMIAQDNTEGNQKKIIPAIESEKHYLELINSNYNNYTSLVFLPETAVPCDFDIKKDEFSLLSDIADKNNLTIFSGAFCSINNKSYNAVFAISNNGIVSNPYLKQILVPFGEKLPFASLFGKKSLSRCSDKSMCKPIEIENNKIGCCICIESIYPSVLRDQALEGCDMFFIPTNDSWFGRSFARYTHYRHSILRAVENSKATVRVGNCGISSVISPWGEPIKSIFDNNRSAINTYIKTQHNKSLYTYFGDSFFVSFCILWTALCLLISNTVNNPI